MRVLIVKTSSLVDIVQALPVVDFLHQTVPGIEIDWVVEQRFADILAGNPFINRLIIVEAEKWRRKLFSLSTWREIFLLKADLAASRYNIAFDLQGDLQSGLIAKYSGCNRRYGFAADVVKEPANLRFTTNQVPLRRQDQHITDRCLRLVSVPFGKDYPGMDLSVHLPADVAEDQAADIFLAALLDGLVFLFHPYAAWETRRWSEQGWIELGRELTGFYPDGTIVIPWSCEKERIIAENIARGVGRHVKLVQGLSIKGLCALIKKVDMVVGGDEVPVHIAAAAGTPTVSFYRATDGKKSGPRGDIHRIIQSPLPCARCLKDHCDKDRDCRDSIEVKAMLAAAQELLS